MKKNIFIAALFCAFCAIANAQTAVEAEAGCVTYNRFDGKKFARLDLQAIYDSTTVYITLTNGVGVYAAIDRSGSGKSYAGTASRKGSKITLNPAIDSITTLDIGEVKSARLVVSEKGKILPNHPAEVNLDDITFFMLDEEGMDSAETIYFIWSLTTKDTFTIDYFNSTSEEFGVTKELIIKIGEKKSLEFDMGGGVKKTYMFQRTW